MSIKEHDHLRDLISIAKIDLIKFLADAMHEFEGKKAKDITFADASHFIKKWFEEK